MIKELFGKKTNDHEITREEYYLKPGFLYVTQAPTVITTILGSCVSICLFDRQCSIGGMNHYQLPQPLSGDENTTKFGSASIPALINSLEEIGAKRKNLQAHIIGGASISGNTQSQLVADMNIQTAYLQLEKYGVSVVSAKTGGNRGRKAVFFTNTGILEFYYVDAPVEEPEIPTGLGE